MQTPSILQQITPPNSQIKKNSDSNDNNQFKTNSESPSPFKKILNNEVNNQNKNKISTSPNKNESTNISKDQKSVNTNKTIEDDQSEEDSISLSNQNILFFVEDIEQLKDPKNADLLNKDQLLAQDDLQGIQALQALVPSLQVKTENTAAPIEETGVSKESLSNKGIDLAANPKDTAIKNLSTETLIFEKERNIESISIENLTSNALNKTDYLVSKNENTLPKSSSLTTTSLIKEIADDKGKVPLLTNEKESTNGIKNNSNFSIESLVRSTPEFVRKSEGLPIDLKETASTNLTPKIDANLTNQLGVSPDQLKASGLANYIPAQLGTKAWDQAMGQRIIWMVAGGEQSAQLTLNPPDLGPLQVVLKISDNQVDASFISSHLDVRDTLESAMPKLRQMMDDAGIQLSGFSVNSQASQSGQNFTQENASPQTRSIETSQDTNIISIDNSVTKVIKKELGLVDTFV